MPRSDKSAELPSDQEPSDGVTPGKTPMNNDESGNSRRRKRPRRSTQSVKYVYSDDDTNESNDGSINSIQSSDHKSDGESESDSLGDEVVDKDELEREKPSKRRKVGKKATAKNREGIGSFKCPHCGKAFKTQLGLQYHLDNFVCREKDGTPKAKKKDRKPPPKKKARKSVEMLEDRTCPHCKRVFKSIFGLKYHIEQRVCLKESVTHVRKGVVRPFPTLKPGMKFVTPFGIVEVVKDDRAVPTATFPKDIQVRYRKYQKAKLAEDSKVARRHVRIASKLRTRRDAINAIYEKGKANRRSIFEAYFDGDPEHIRSVINANKVLASGGTAGNPKQSALGIDSSPRISDPKEPKDSFPDRIVECILVPDERSHHLDLMKTRATRNAKQGPTKLFLQRKILKEAYNENHPVYHCPDCGRRYNSSQARKPHCEQRKCIQDAKIKKERREARQAKIERDVEDARRFPERRKYIRNKNPTQVVNLEQGKKSKWKRKKKNETSVYPEIVISMGFKLVTKKKITVDDTSLKPSMPRKGKGRDINTILDNLKGTLSTHRRKTGDQLHGSIYAGVYKALGFKKPKRSGIQKTVVKRKRRRCETKAKPAPPPKPLPPAIDVGALVDEIKSGRYPSFKVFQGEHADDCVLCKNGGRMYCCEFCSNVEHFQCILTKFTIKEPEPDEDFMCHQCIGVILSRRARAEKRRLLKQAKNEQAKKEEEENNPSTGNEYPYMASQGRDVSELVELLKDSQIRLRRSIETSKLNNLRRQVIAGIYPDEYSPPY